MLARMSTGTDDDNATLPGLLPVGDQADVVNNIPRHALEVAVAQGG